MKISKILSLFSVIFCVNQCFAETNILNGQDKAKHFAVSAVFGVSSRVLIGEEEGFPIKAFSLAMAPGVLKEVYDATSKNGSGFSKADLGADALGALAGIYLSNEWLKINISKKSAKVEISQSF